MNILKGCANVFALICLCFLPNSLKGMTGFQLIDFEHFVAENYDGSSSQEHLMKLIRWYTSLYIIKEFVEREKIDVNKPDKNGITLLSLAVRYGDQSLVRFLHEQGANAENKLINIAISEYDISMVQLLLELGISSINAKNVLGYTPLHEAIVYGWVLKSKRIFPIIEFLIRKGADLTERNIEKATPLDLARQFNFSEAIEIFKNHENWSKQVIPYIEPNQILHESFVKYSSEIPALENY